MILVTGATGNVGREVVTQLLGEGRQVRAMTRNLPKAKFDPRVEVVQGDFDAPDTLTRAVSGVDQVFSLTLGPKTGTHEGTLARAARKAGVRRIVKLSAMGGDGITKNAIRKWHEEGEEAIKDTGIEWTMVRPGGFMSNALHWRESIRKQGKVFSNYADGKVAPVHPSDIAAVAVRALTSDGHEGKTYHLTGPEALSIGEQVTILSEMLDRKLEYVAIGDEAARQGMERAGLPGYLVDALIPFAAFIRSGKASEVLPTVKEVTGKPALTFREWALEHVQAFQ